MYWIMWRIDMGASHASKIEFQEQGNIVMGDNEGHVRPLIITHEQRNVKLIWDDD